MSEGAPSSDCRWRRSEYSYFSKNKPAGNRENPGNQSQRGSDQLRRQQQASHLGQGKKGWDPFHMIRGVKRVWWRLTAIFSSHSPPHPLFLQQNMGNLCMSVKPCPQATTQALLLSWMWKLQPFTLLHASLRVRLAAFFLPKKLYWTTFCFPTFLLFNILILGQVARPAKKTW